MEGVLVTAKKAGSTIAITVVSDEKGNYRFPASKLDAGHYAISIRAVGYDLDGPNAVDVTAQKTSDCQRKLRKTTNLSLQLTNAEWLESIPGTQEQKSALRNCVNCHMLQRPIFSKHTADEFVKVQLRMANYSNQSTPEVPQPRLAQRLADQQDVGEEGGQDRQQKAMQ